MDGVMRYQISEKAYATKPEKEEWSRVTWKWVEGSIDDLYRQIGVNHIYRANMASTSNSGNKDFVSSQVVMLDYDKEEITMDYFVSATSLLPTFYYRTHSSDHTGNRFRLGYVFDKPIYSPYEYKVIARAIAEHNGVLGPDDFDKTSFSPYQNHCGAEYGISTTGAIMPLDKMKRKIQEENPYAFVEKDRPATERMPIERRELTEEEQMIKDDFYCTSYTYFISKYMDKPVTCSDPIRENEAFWFYDKENYFEVFRKIGRNEDGRMSYYHRTEKGWEPMRFKDGECRRRKIAVSISFIHQIKPDITLSELLAQTLHYINSYIDNTQDSISNHWIWNTVFDEYVNPQGYRCNIRKSMKMKKEYFGYSDREKHPKTRIKEYKKNYSLSLYDNNDSFEDNYDRIRAILEEESGGVMSISKRTLMSYLKEENVVEEKPIKKVKNLYSQGILTMELLDSFKEQIDKNSYYKYRALINEER